MGFGMFEAVGHSWVLAFISCICCPCINAAACANTQELPGWTCTPGGNGAVQELKVFLVIAVAWLLDIGFFALLNLGVSKPLPTLMAAAIACLVFAGLARAGLDPSWARVIGRPKPENEN